MNQRTPLYDTHVASGARMVPFGGWDMPVQYSEGIIHEVRQVRNDVGIFDVSHMARLEFRGADAGRFLDTVLSVRASRLEHGLGRYHVICNETGGIIDDAIVYNLSENRFLLVVNAGNADTDRAWLRSKLNGFAAEDGDVEVELVDRSLDIAMIAVQGPNSVSMLDDLTGDEAGLTTRFHAGEATLDGERILTVRTGYTGEDGFEIMFDSGHAPGIWNILVDSGATECGLGARDVLRLEAGLMLHGSDMTVENNPYEAGLRWTVKPNRSEYIAGEALRRIRDNGTPRRIAGFVMRSRGIARHGHANSHRRRRGRCHHFRYTLTYLGICHRHGIHRHRTHRNRNRSANRCARSDGRSGSGPIAVLPQRQASKTYRAAAAYSPLNHFRICYS